MSSAGHGKANANVDELDPDEPRTPLWLPLVGLCLFLAALIYMLTGTDHGTTTVSEAASASAEPSAAPAAAPAPHPAQ